MTFETYNGVEAIPYVFSFEKVLFCSIFTLQQSFSFAPLHLFPNQIRFVFRHIILEGIRVLRLSGNSVRQDEKTVVELLLSLSVDVPVLELRRIREQNLHLLQSLHYLLKDLEVFVTRVNRTDEILTAIVNCVVLLLFEVLHNAGWSMEIVFYTDWVLLLISGERTPHLDVAVDEVLIAQLLNSFKRLFLLLAQEILFERQIGKLCPEKLESHLRPEFTKCRKADTVDLVVCKMSTLQ